MTRTPRLQAQSAVFRAVQDGTLARAKGQKCIVCEGPAAHLHHPSYLPAHHLDVVPVCIACHASIHASRIPDPVSGAIWTKERRPRKPTASVRYNRCLYADKLKAARVAAGLSQKAAAERAGMSPNNWCNIEGGWYGCNEATLRRMAAAVGQSLTCRLGGECDFVTLVSP